MLGISFKGRYNRKQFWGMSLSITLLTIVITLPFQIVIQKFHYHVVQAMIAREIIACRGTIKQQDIDNLKESVENDSNMNLKAKAELEKNLDEMEKMSDIQLTELANQGLTTNEMVLIGTYLIIVLFLSYAGFSVYVKRGHDFNLSGWVTFIALILPFINFIYLIYLGFFKGDPLANQYGSPSISKSHTKKIN